MRLSAKRSSALDRGESDLEALPKRLNPHNFEGCEIKWLYFGSDMRMDRNPKSP